jgi:hypothetical protein
MFCCCCERDGERSGGRREAAILVNLSRSFRSLSLASAAVRPGAFAFTMFFLLAPGLLRVYRLGYERGSRGVPQWF